ncbi:hypothetical protein F4782DRAFT_368270 [Xylaria castorea]|nr:hypothetical protein F4782DRAFT_368270 [Xylaria castorea]
MIAITQRGMWARVPPRVYIFSSFLSYLFPLHSFPCSVSVHFPPSFPAISLQQPAAGRPTLDSQVRIIHFPDQRSQSLVRYWTITGRSYRKISPG